MSRSSARTGSSLAGEVDRPGVEPEISDPGADAGGADLGAGDVPLLERHGSGQRHGSFAALRVEHSNLDLRALRAGKQPRCLRQRTRRRGADGRGIRERHVADADHPVARAESGTPDRRVLGHREDKDALGAGPQLHVVRNHHVGFDDLGEAVSQDVQVTAGEFVDHPVQHVVEVLDRRRLPDLRLVPGPDGVPVDAAQRRVEVLVADGLPDETEGVLPNLVGNRVGVLERGGGRHGLPLSQCRRGADAVGVQRRQRRQHGHGGQRGTQELLHLAILPDRDAELNERPRVRVAAG